jgi:nucleoside-diphosphate-sugar epimerase
MPHLFCIGFGFCAHALAARMMGSEFQITATFRGLPNATMGSDSNVSSVPFGETPPADTSHILISVPPGVQGDAGLDAYGDWITERAASLEWVGYLSTTGVYGDRGGAMVDEGSMLKPTSDRSRRRVEAERDWLKLHHDARLPLHIFRLAGIYGPGRSAIDALMAGSARRIDKPDHKFSRIHVEDVATVLLASMAHPNPGAIHNVCDNEAAQSAEIVAYAADIMGVAAPPLTPFSEAELSPMAQSFYKDNKRVRNRKILKELGVTLKYPTYREGIEAIWAATKNDASKNYK